MILELLYFWEDFAIFYFYWEVLVDCQSFVLIIMFGRQLMHLNTMFQDGEIIEKFPPGKNSSYLSSESN